MQAVILAGGKGTRLGKFSKTTPKPLIRIGGMPIIEHQILLLRQYSIKNIWLLSGYRGEQIKDYLGDGKKWHVKIRHLIESKPMGTGGAIKNLEGKIKGDFLVFSGDVICDFDLDRFVKFHKKHLSATATIIVHPNDHPYDSDLIETDNNNRVTSILLRKDKRHPKNFLFRNVTNSGIFIFSEKIFRHIKKNNRCDLEKDIFPQVLKFREEIFAYNTPEYIKDLGTPKRLQQIRKDYRLGKIQRRNLKNKQKAIFLDRDGTLNHHDGINDVRASYFRLFPFTAKAIKKINQAGYLAIVVTNQPVIAKGMISQDENALIFKKLEKELGWQGAKIDAIYVCPHHPERGFKSELPFLKIKCTCRKPKTGLIRRAVKDLNIDLSSSFFIGDSTIDAKCAENARIKFIGVKTGYGLRDGRYQVNNYFEIAKNLLEAVSLIIDDTRP